MKTTLTISLDHAAAEVVEVLSNNLGSDGFASAITHTEAEALAELCIAAGYPGVGQEFMLAWAEGDEDADEYEEELAEWGITQAAADTGYTWGVETEMKDGS